MIRVTVELIPFGLEDHPRRQVLGTAEIANIGGTDHLGVYRARFRGRAHQKLWTAGVVDFPRTRLLAWDLLYWALSQTPVADRFKKERL
jgi:hypothetical protein